ncbi:hypothetical protein PACTADRAFT_50714 [Pachysolen tannophilus NRRL Y-2460]|uniref:Uncharacterized protein n=1 Tax=Pachysolen tannophilus NRRL Y-2460 TaxID=669874 RepID=A0A1E4TSZ4_PACTA|nr:hypothetical protein PACTADRAFT_50714 [Pachysolen tannophilus NRRL Y-2460]
MASIITPERLLKLWQDQLLRPSWYLFAANTLAACNQPQEIPKIYHMALKTADGKEATLQTANEAIEQCEKTLKRRAEGSMNAGSVENSNVGLHTSSFSSLESMIPSMNNTFKEKLSSGYNAKLIADQSGVTIRMREGLLKGLPICGIPMTINAINSLNGSIPHYLTTSEAVDAGALAVLSSLVEVRRKSQKAKLSPQTMAIKLGPSSINRNFWKSYFQIKEEREDGYRLFNIMSNKKRDKFISMINGASNELYKYMINDLHGSLLAFENILERKETALCILGSVFPQRVDNMLKNYFRGAIRNGNSREEIYYARLMGIEICKWCGVEFDGEVPRYKLLKQDTKEKDKKLKKIIKKQNLKVVKKSMIQLNRI